MTPFHAQVESARRQDLGRHDILDTPGEESFDRITRLAARVLRRPIAALNFIDRQRQWSKSAVGPGRAEMPRDHATYLNRRPSRPPDHRGHPA